MRAESLQMKLTSHWSNLWHELTADDVIRHYDVTGKDCPKYFVENSNAWSDFKTDLLTYIDTYGIEKTQEIN